MFRLLCGYAPREWVVCLRCSDVLGDAPGFCDEFTNSGGTVVPLKPFCRCLWCALRRESVVWVSLINHDEDISDMTAAS